MLSRCIEGAVSLDEHRAVRCGLDAVAFLRGGSCASPSARATVVAAHELAEVVEIANIRSGPRRDLEHTGWSNAHALPAKPTATVRGTAA